MNTVATPAPPGVPVRESVRGTARAPARTQVRGPAREPARRETLSVHDLVAERDLTLADLDLIFRLAAEVKASPRSFARALEGKQLALIFEKPSLRTRVSFEVGMTSMGGFAVYLDHTKPRLGERESIKTWRGTSSAGWMASRRAPSRTPRWQSLPGTLRSL